MSKKIAVIVSDLHIGRGNRLDNFSGDRVLEDFCLAIQAYARAQQAELTVVLAGDVFEMWESAPDDEIDPRTPWRHIAQHLFYPASGSAAEAAAEARVAWQLDAALEAHPAFGRAVVDLIRGGVRVVYLPGNHDHPMVNPAMQAHLRRRLGIAEGDLPVVPYYGDADLQLYVEHGHQFADADCSYPDDQLDDWRIEAPGYYFLRLVYCRLEGLPETDVPWYEMVPIFLKMVYRPDLPNHPAKSYLYEYFTAHEELGFPLARGFRVPLVSLPPWGYIIPELYEHWKAHDRPTSGLDTLDHEARQLIGRGRIERIDSTPPGAAGFGETAADHGEERLPGRLIQYAGGGRAQDRYARGFRGRFARARHPFPRLVFEDGLTVVAGHTHREHHSRLMDRSGARPGTVRYLNTGSWSVPGRTAYAVVNNFESDFQRRRLYVLG